MPKTITEKTARELALKLLRAKLVDHPELAQIQSDETLKLVAGGIKSAFEGRGIFVDREAAEGIVDAMAEVIPLMTQAAKPSVRSGLWTPEARPRVWRPS